MIIPVKAFPLILVLLAGGPAAPRNLDKWVSLGNLRKEAKGLYSRPSLVRIRLFAFLDIWMATLQAFGVADNGY